MTWLVYSVAFLLLATMTGWAAASLRVWALRLPVLAATPVLAVAVGWALVQQDGWPTSRTPADGSTFSAAVIRSPAPGDAGAIFLWLIPPHGATPRGYRLPYSPQLERQVAHAAREQKHGHQVAVTTKQRRGRGQHRGQHLPRALLRFYRLPPASTERKTP